MYPNATPKNYDYCYSFAFYGFIGLIQDWINNNKEESIENMAKLTSEMIVKSSTILHY
ncbi:TetR-like C-terminal domain-containing protein [Clostridium cuniculi]|uniref:TetR-like C-terminal domain-containing protein n=1 Tax=Clostridium cuniculi TaxID=2548455 RepID=UPI003C2E69AD